MKWVLILTLFNNGSAYSSGSSIESIPNFKSKELCLAAGQIWLKQVQKYAQASRVTCVPYSD